MLRIHTWRDKAICGKWRLPDLNKDGTEPKKCFTAHGHRFFHPCVVYSDFEEFWEKTPDGYEGKASAHMEVVGCNAKVASVAGVVADRGYKAPERLRAFMSRESNCMVAYFQHLFAVAYDYSEARANPKPLEKTPEVRRRHAQARKCYLCTKDFDSDNKAVMDHDHWTGAYRGAACDKCNKMAQNPRDVRVFFHNFSHYDCHALLRFITLLRRKELDGEPNNITARQLVEGRSLPADVVGMDIDDLDAGGEGEEAEEEEEGEGEEYDGTCCTGTSKWYDIPIRRLRFAMMPKTGESMRQIIFGPLTFLDSIAFLDDSMDQIIKEHKKEHEADLSAGFPRTATCHPTMLRSRNRVEDLKELTRKLPFAYRALIDHTVFDRPAVLTQAEYFNDLKREACTDEEYAEIQRLARHFGWQTFGDAHDAYLWNDVYLMLDCFEAFRDAFYETSEIDPFHSMTLPTASQHAIFLRLLQTRGPEFGIEYVTDRAFMERILGNVRGGLSNPFLSHLTANHPKAPWYDPSQPESRLCYGDVNSLYSDGMSHALPVGNYSELDLDGLSREDRIKVVEKLADRYTEDDPQGQLCVITYEIPKDEHDFIDFAPVRRMQVPWSEVSQRQRDKVKQHIHDDWAENWLRENPGLNLPAFEPKEPRDVEKLVPWLGEHPQVMLHIAHIKLLRELFDIEITEVHEVYCFDQERWLAPIFKEMSERRAQQTSKIKAACEKLKMNTFYGKMLQNLLGKDNVTLYTDSDQFLRAAFRPQMKDFGTFTTDEKCFLGWVKNNTEKGILLNTLRVQGLVTLEWTKIKMLQLHYGVYKKYFGDHAELGFTDTDSFIHRLTLTPDVLHRLKLQDRDPKLLETEDILAAINCIEPVFDLSKATGDDTYKGKLGFTKLEIGGKQTLLAYAGAQSKMYALYILEQEGVKVSMYAKGLPKSVVKKECGWNDYVRAIYEFAPAGRLECIQMRSRDHIMEHIKLSKRGITANNFKVFQLAPDKSRPLGHWRNYEPEAALENSEVVWAAARARL
jgi:hypothetical protein